MFGYEDVFITPVQEEDSAFLGQIRNDPKTLSNLTTFSLVSNESQKAWIRTLSQSSDKYFVLWNRVDEVFPVGVLKLTSADNTNRSVQVGIDIHPMERKKKFSQRGWKLALYYCFSFMNIHRVWLEVLKENVEAIHIYTKLGFITEGILREAVFRNGAYRDKVIMSLLRKEYEERNERDTSV